MKNYGRFLDGKDAFPRMLAEKKAALPVDFPWYPYNTMENVVHLPGVVGEEHDFLFAGDLAIADIGAADGDLAFYLESLGNRADIFDYGPTNMNGLRGARAMKEALGSAVNINEIDIDKQFKLDRNYDLIFFLGILYHLKNPFFICEELSQHSRYMFVSTRVIRHFVAGGPDISDSTSAYLVHESESNNDATNFWMFTQKGLKLMLERAGWRVVKMITLGDTVASNPQDANHDERAFALLESKHFA